MTLSRKLIDKLIKFTQSVYKIHFDLPEIPLPQEILDLIPKIDESKVLARKQNLNSIVNNAQLSFECRFTLISTLLGFIGSQQISSSQMPYISLIILQSCCGIFFWELKNVGSHYSLVFIRAFCKSVPFLQNMINEMKNFFSLFVERIYDDGEIDLTIQYLPAINEVISKYPLLSENCIQLLLKIAKKLCKKLKTENMPINQTNISYFFHNLSNAVNKFPHQNFDHSKIIKRLLEISKLPTPTYLLDSYLSLLLSFHYHNSDIIPLLEQISNGLINADSSSLNHIVNTDVKFDSYAELNEILTQNNQELLPKYYEYFSSKNPSIPTIPNLNEIPESISGPIVNAAKEIADHFNDSCKIKDYFDFLYILLNCQNFNVQAILLICILISGPPLRSQISELFARRNLWNFFLSERIFNPSINIFDDNFSRLINLRQSIFDVLAFMCTTTEVIFSIRKSFLHFLSKFVQNPRYASEIVLMSYPSLQPIYLLQIPNNEQDEMMTLLFEIVIKQQYNFFKDNNASLYRFPTLTVILSILKLNNCLNLCSNSEYSCKALLSLIFERPLIPHIEELIMKLAKVSSEKIKENPDLSSVPFANAFHKLFKAIIGRPDMSDLLLKILKMIEKDPFLIFLKNRLLINDLFSASFSCSSEDLPNREKILEYFLRILLKFKNFNEFDPTIVPFIKIAQVCKLVGTFITINEDETVTKSTLFDILYEICISEDVITLPEALPMLCLSLTDKTSQKFIMNKLIELCKDSEINRYSCLIGNIPSIVFDHKYDKNFELFELISMTTLNPKSLRTFFQCFESDEFFDEALNYLSAIIDKVETVEPMTKIQFTSQGSHVTFPRISSTILDNGFIVHSTLFIESDEPNRHFFILKGGKNTFSIKFFHGSLLLQVESGDSNYKYVIDANYPLKKWFELSLMMKASEGLTVGFDGNIVAGLSIESIELGNNIDYSFIFFTHFSENSKPIQMHSIYLYANFSANDISIADFDTYQNILQNHLYYTFSADNVLNRTLIDDDSKRYATFSGSPIQFDCNFLRAFEVTQSISVLLTLFRKVEHKPKLFDSLLMIVFNIIEKSTVVSNQMVKINGMAVISYFLEKHPPSELTKEKWKFFVDQIDKIKTKSLLRHFVKFIFYNFMIWSHSSLEVQMQVICDWQQIGIFFEEFLTVPFLLKTFNNFYKVGENFSFSQDFDQNKNAFLRIKSQPHKKSDDGNDLGLTSVSSASLVQNLNQDSETDAKTNFVPLASSASSSLADLSLYMNSSSTIFSESLSGNLSRILSQASISEANFLREIERDTSLDDGNGNNNSGAKNEEETNKTNNENINENELEKNIEEKNESEIESTIIQSDKSEDKPTTTNDEGEAEPTATYNKSESESITTNDEGETESSPIQNDKTESNKIQNNKGETEPTTTNDKSEAEPTTTNDKGEAEPTAIQNDKSEDKATTTDDKGETESAAIRNDSDSLSKNDDELIFRSNSDDNKNTTDSNNSDDSKSIRRMHMFNHSIGNFVLDQQSRTPTKKRRNPMHKRSSSIESVSHTALSRQFRSNSISSITYQKMIEDKLNSIRKIIISLMNSVISLNKLNKREALFLFQAIQKAKQPEESLNLLEVVSFVVDSKLYMSSFDIRGQWIMLFLHRSETFRIRWLNLFSKMYPNPSSELSQSILFLLIIQTQVALTNSMISTESLLVECVRICLGINKVLNLKNLDEIPINFSNAKIQYFHFAIAISIAAQGELNNQFASSLFSLTKSDDFASQIASSSTTLTLFILIYWVLRRSQGEKDETPTFSLSMGSINDKIKDNSNFNQFSFPLKVDSVDQKAVKILSKICSFSPSLAKTTVGIIDSISTITKANLSELRSEFLNTLFPIASTSDFIQIIAESIFFHYKPFNFPLLPSLYETFNLRSNSRKFFDAQVPDLITLLNVYIGDIDRSPVSSFSLEIDKEGKWLDESLVKSLIYVASASKSDKLKPILSILIYTFCRNQKQSEIASLIPLIRELITEKDCYSYLIIYAVYREKINSFLDLSSSSSSNNDDSSLKKRRRTEMVPTRGDEAISSPRSRRRYSDINNKYVKIDDDSKKLTENSQREIKFELNNNSEVNRSSKKVEINLGSLQSVPRKSYNSITSNKKTNITEVPKFSSPSFGYPFDDELPESVKSLIKSDPKFLRTCYITMTQFCENAPKTLTDVHKKLIETFSSIQTVFTNSTYRKCAIHQTEKYLAKRAWEVLWHQMFTSNQTHFKRSSCTDYLSRPIILRRNFGFDKKINDIKNSKKTDSFIENCIDSNEPLFEGRCDRIKIDKTISGTFYILYSGIHRFNKEGINDRIEKKILRFISDRGKLIDIAIEDVVRILPMFVLQKKTAIEILTEQQRSYLFNFKTCQYVNQFMSFIPLRLQFPTGKFLSNLTDSWCKRNISNYEYLTWLNLLSGRTFNTTYSYPIFPWILSDYESSSINLDDPKVYRDLSKPIGALNPTRLQKLKKLRQDNTEEESNFLYRSTYSCAFHVFHYLVRLEPFTSLHIIMQDGKFDVAHRLFSSIYNSYERITSTIFNFRELIPEFFFCSNFLTNKDKYKFGGGIDNVSLPPWSKSPIDFIYKNRRALESESVSSHLNEWIDLIWGFKQTGQAAEDADNLFDPHLYPNVWLRYRFNDKGDGNNAGEADGSKLAMKKAGILMRNHHHHNHSNSNHTHSFQQQIKRASIALPENSAVTSFMNSSVVSGVAGSVVVVDGVNGEDSSASSPSSPPSLLNSSSASIILAQNQSTQSDPLYKNPQVDPNSVPQSVLNSTSKQQIEQLLSHVGQIPQQLFDSPHPTRQPHSQQLLMLISSSASSFAISTATAANENSQQSSSSSQNSPSSTKQKTNQQRHSYGHENGAILMTESILDLAYMSLSKSGISNNNSKSEFINDEKIGRIYLDFYTVPHPPCENNAVCCSNEKYLTLRRDGRIYNSFGPLTKDRILHLSNFISIGFHSFAAICNSTNEIVHFELFSSADGFSASAPSLPRMAMSSAPQTSSISSAESDSHFTILRRKSPFHVSKVTSICNVGNSIFAGDVDGIVSNESSEFLLTVHRKGIVCMAGCEALRIVVSVSSDNLVVISAADDLCFIRSFKIDKEIGKVKKVVICKGFGIINFLIENNRPNNFNSKILAYSVNGDYIGCRSLCLHVTNMVAVTCLSNDLDLLVISDNKKKIYTINAFELADLTELKEVESQVTALNVFAQLNQQQLIIGTELGFLYYCNFNI